MKNIYVVLSQTGTFFSKAIRLYTKDPYNHASIAFDGNLDVMYSFGRKRRYNLLNNGFITENFNKGIFSYFPQARCCILEISVTDAEYESMNKTIRSFCVNQDMYRFNLVGVLGQTLGKDLTRKNHFFCSQFVSYVLNNAAFWQKSPSFTKPMDFFEIPKKRIVFEGCIRDFTIQDTDHLPAV